MLLSCGGQTKRRNSDYGTAAAANETLGTGLPSRLPHLGALLTLILSDSLILLVFSHIFSVLFQFSFLANLITSLCFFIFVFSSLFEGPMTSMKIKHT